MLIPLDDLAATERLGQSIAKVLRAGDVVALTGGLGAGQTTLARAIISALGYSGEIPSPSFSVIQTYEVPQVLLNVVHADFYRLNHPREAQELGLDDYRQNAALIAEWPENAGGFAHEAACLSITMEVVDGAHRALVSGSLDWLERMAWT